MILTNGDTVELICFVTHIKYQIGQRRTFPRLSKAMWPVVMAMDIVAMVSYIYCMASQWFKTAFNLGKGLGLGFGIEYAFV